MSYGYRKNDRTPLGYVNVYETWQEYGGPEEGGWYYRCGEPVESIPYYTHDGKERAASRARRDYHGNEYQIKYQSHPGKSFPEVTPHYE